MTYMLCRNRVKDFARWEAVFSSHDDDQQNSGLKLSNMWRSVDEPNNVFMMFEVSDIDKARAFISDPKAAEAGEISGVIDGECHFIQPADQF